MIYPMNSYYIPGMSRDVNWVATQLLVMVFYLLQGLWCFLSGSREEKAGETVQLCAANLAALQDFMLAWRLLLVANSANSAIHQQHLSLSLNGVGDKMAILLVQMKINHLTFGLAHSGTSFASATAPSPVGLWWSHVAAFANLCAGRAEGQHFILLLWETSWVLHWLWWCMDMYGDYVPICSHTTVSYSVGYIPPWYPHNFTRSPWYVPVIKHGPLSARVDGAWWRYPEMGRLWRAFPGKSWVRLAVHVSVCQCKSQEYLKLWDLDSLWFTRHKENHHQLPLSPALDR